MSDINQAIPDANVNQSAQTDFNLSDLLSKLMPQATSDSKSSQGESKGGADLFSSLLSNPELLSKLPRLISVIGPLMSSFSQNQGQSQESSLPAQETIESHPEIPGKPRFTSDSRAALLCAMKPYLCHDRQNAIDYIIKLSRLGEILKTL